MSLQQYSAYCKSFHTPAVIDRSKSRNVKGIGGTQYCFGSATIPVPFPNIGIVVEIEFFISDATSATLLCLKDLKRTGFDLDIQKDRLHFMGRFEPLELRNGLLYHDWSQNIALLSENELFRIHRSFGHPSVSSLFNVLKRARPSETCKRTRKSLEKLVKECEVCARHASRPRRFKLTVGNEDSRFNHSVAVDIMYIGGKPVLHVVDEATHFSAASWLRRISTTDVWKAILRCGTHVYMGPPDHLRVDQGSQFVSEEFKSLAQAAGVHLLEAPVESPNSMTHTERYHGPLRVAYEKLNACISKALPVDLLQMAVHCVNSTVGPEGLCPALCVFGAIPNPIRNTPAPSQLERARAIDAAMRDVEKHHAKRKVQFALKYRGPYGKESSQLDALTFGAKVLVYREKSSSWDGPHTFISKYGETVCVQLKHGRRIFRSSVVKPFLSDKSTGIHIDGNIYTAVENFGDAPDYGFSRKKELDGLIARGVFEIVDRSSVPAGCQIFGTRFINAMKPSLDGPALEKSRLVAQNYRDFSALQIPTKSPTISRMGQRIALSIMAMDTKLEAYSGDVTQAYTQSDIHLGRDVFLEPVEEMNLPKNKVLKAVKPLYGIPEAGLYWFLTYHEHHVSKLGMQPCTMDPCLLFKRQPGREIPSLVMLQVDDTFGAGTNEFLDLEENQSGRFLTKPRKILTIGGRISFNGATVHRKTLEYEMHQSDKLRSTKIPTSNEEATRQRAKAQYTASVCRPDLSSMSQMLSSKLLWEKKNCLSEVSKLMKYCQDTADTPLRFVPLDLKSLRILLFTDAAFANGENLASQLGFLIILADDTGMANIVHYGSSKCKRITRSVMAAELLALVHGFYQAYVVQQTLFEILGRSVPIDALVDSRTTFNCIAKNSSSSEKRLQIDAAALRQSLQRGELRRLGWLPGKCNPADALARCTIPNHDHPLLQIMHKNKIIIDATGWTENTEKEKEK